jgi:hypothetical protein
MEFMEQNSKQISDLKTLIEHESIILQYKNTGHIDRVYAISKYREFNRLHPDYYRNMELEAKATGTSISIENANDYTIVQNLNRQLCYLTGKNLLEEYKNG